MDNSLLKKKMIVLLGVCGSAFSSILIKITNAPSEVLVFYRMLISVILLSVPYFISLKKEWKNIHIKEVLCCCCSGFFLAIHFRSYFLSVINTNIVSATVLAGTEIFFVAFIMLIFFKEKINKAGWTGIILTFSGSVVIAVADAGNGANLLKGDIYAISAAFFLAVYTIMGKICRKTMSTTVYTTSVYFIAAIFSMIFVLIQRIPLFGYDKVNYISAFGMAVLCTLMGHSIFSWGLKYLSASYVSIVKLSDPVFASILAFIFFSQIPAIMVIFGCLIVIGGLFIFVTKSE